MMHKQVNVKWSLVIVATVAATVPWSVTSELHANNHTPPSRPVLKLPTHGGPNGTPFDDVKNITPYHATIVKIHSIDIGSIYQVDYIQVTYLLSNGSRYKSPEHGDGIFTPETIELSHNEFVEKIEGKTNGNCVNQLTITTYTPKLQTRKVYGPYGTTKLNATQDFVYQGNIVGFYGTTGKYILRSIGVYSIAPVNKSNYFGLMSAEHYFVDDPDAIFPPISRLYKLHIYHGKRVNAMQADYQLYGGGIHTGRKHGGKGGNVTVITFAPDEHIIGVEGKMDSSPTHVLCQLTFITTDKYRHTKRYGPFGRGGKNQFSLSVNVVSFAGSALDAIVGIQVFYY